MIAIQKFTLGYDKVQDRISMTAQGSKGEFVLLWLTQRLLNRLARVLVQRLDRELEGAVTVGSLHDPVATSPRSESPPISTSNLSRGGRSAAAQQAGLLPQLHAMEQSAAQSVLKAERPVQPTAQVEGNLVISLDLGSTAKGYVIVCRWSTDGAAQLVMNSVQLRQFMGMLYRVVVMAEWPRAMWPDWFAASSSTDAAAPVVLH